MKKYIAYATMSAVLKYEFEVEDDQDPWEVATVIDAGDFEEVEGSSGWKLYDVREVKPNKC